MGSAILNMGFLVVTFATVYFGAVVYAETVGATVDQLVDEHAVDDEHAVRAGHDDW